MWAMIGRNKVAVFWKAGNGPFLDLVPDLHGCYLYKSSKPTVCFIQSYIAQILKMLTPRKNVTERKIWVVEINLDEV